MNKIIRLWNQHRKGFILAIGAFIFLIIVIQVLNQVAKSQKEARNENRIILTEEEKNLPTRSSISGEKVDLDITKDNVAIIEDFIAKCNNQDVSSAYALLTDDCKELLYPNEEMFKVGYIDIIFTTKRVANIENFLNNGNRYTYYINYQEDSLSTGKISGTNTYQDYITIDTDGKLNIDNLIYKNEVNKESERDGIKIKVLSQAIYKDKEEYQIQIENATDKDISIIGSNTSSIYLVDDNNTKYNSNAIEIAESSYQIPSYMYRTYNLGFKKIYSAGVKSRAIDFLDIVADYDKYEFTPDEVNERVKIRVEL